MERRQQIESLFQEALERSAGAPAIRAPTAGPLPTATSASRARNGPILGIDSRPPGLGFWWGFCWRGARCHLLSPNACNSMKTW